MGEGVDAKLSLIGGDRAGELGFVEVEAELGGGDLACGGDLEATKRQAAAVDPEVVVAIHWQTVVVVVVAAKVQGDGLAGVTLVPVEEEADVAVA